MLENVFTTDPFRRPLLSVILTILMVGLGFVIVGPLIGFFVALPFFPGTIIEFQQAIEQPHLHPEIKWPVYIIQAFAALVGLVVVPQLILRRYHSSLRIFFSRSTSWTAVLLTGMIVILFIPVNSVFIEWNANVHFPDFAKGFEEWARAREEAAEGLVKTLTTLDSLFDLAIAVVVIGILPAVGEEIVFRGLIQNELNRGLGNIHVAIWVSAILFSAIHVQFFGFVPRVFLGALFGYLYYWSGNLTLAIVAHFVNNGLQVVALYFYQRGAFDFDIETAEAAPAGVVIAGAIATGALLYYFYKYFDNQNPHTRRT